MFHIISMWTLWCSILSLCEQCDVPHHYVNSMMFHIIIMWTVWCSIISLCEITLSWPLTIFSLSWSCFLLIRKKLSKLKYLREEENWRSLSSGLWCRGIKVTGLEKLCTLSANVAPTRVSYTQCTTDAYSNFLLISKPIEDCFFPNPLGQMPYFISLFLTFVFFLG